MFDQEQGKFNVVSFAHPLVSSQFVDVIVSAFLKKQIRDTVNSCVKRRLSHEQTFNSVCEKLQSYMPTAASVEFRDRMLKEFNIDSRDVKHKSVTRLATLGEIQDYYMQLADLDQNRKR